MKIILPALVKTDNKKEGFILKQISRSSEINSDVKKINDSIPYYIIRFKFMSA